MVNAMFNKVLGGSEKCVFSFLLNKLKELFGQPSISGFPEKPTKQEMSGVK